MIRKREAPAGSTLATLDASVPARDALQGLSASADFVILKASKGRRRLYKAGVLRAAVQLEPDATLAKGLGTLPSESLFILDDVPKDEDEWRAVARDLLQSGAPGIVVEWSTSAPRLYTMAEVMDAVRPSAERARRVGEAMAGGSPESSIDEHYAESDDASSAGHRGGGGARETMLRGDLTRRYVCRKCAPPTSRRPGSGGAPVCPSDPLHGVMTPA